MKQVVTVTEVDGEGLEALLNENVLIYCMNYFYAGKLVGVNDKFVKLEGARIVYETGPSSDKQYKDAQPLPNNIWYVQTAAIESFGLGK